MHAQTEHRGLSGSRTIQVEIGRVQIDRAAVGFGQITYGRDVVQVGVGKENRIRLGPPGLENGGDTVRLVTRVDDQRPVGRVRVTDDVAIRLEGAYGQSANLQPAGGGGAQTENEVPQPQDPVAFGLSNVKPDPLKLL
jgi:hypothetical protein